MTEENHDKALVRFPTGFGLLLLGMLGSCSFSPFWIVLIIAGIIGMVSGSRALVLFRASLKGTTMKGAVASSGLENPNALLTGN